MTTRAYFQSNFPLAALSPIPVFLQSFRKAFPASGHAVPSTLTPCPHVPPPLPESSIFIHSFKFNSNPTSLEEASLIAQESKHPSHNFFFLSMDYFIGCFIKKSSTHILCPHQEGKGSHLLFLYPQGQPLPTNICIPATKMELQRVYMRIINFLAFVIVQTAEGDYWSPHTIFHWSTHFAFILSQSSVISIRTGTCICPDFLLDPHFLIQWLDMQVLTNIC